MTEIQFDGCMYGLPSYVPKTSGMSIATSMNEMCLLGRKCDHKLGGRAPGAGADTKATEGYTDELVIQLHAAVAEWCLTKGAL